MDAIKRGAAKMGQNHQVYICTFYTSGQITSQYICQKPSFMKQHARTKFKVEKIDAKLLNQQHVSRTKRWLHLQRLLCIFFMKSN
ncbi:hypothetical protein P8452_08957 [Trifolium repens]|nr:hypothetical protein P8452_08957 [Trifolium repens]